MEDNIRSSYFDLDNPASFSSASGFKRNTQGSPNLKTITEALSHEPTYTLHRSARVRYPRRKIFIPGIGNQYVADLVDLQRFKRYNSGYSYLLSCMDGFSKYAHMVPLRSKRPEAVIDGFKLIFETAKTIPVNLQTDKG